MTLDPTVEASVARYLRFVDRARPGLVSGFYVVGSVAQGAYRPGRSDIDFVCLLSRDLGVGDLSVLRLAHIWTGSTNAGRAVTAGRSPLTGTLNGVFVGQAEITLPVSRIRAVASQVGERFRVGRAGSDLSPVGWKVLADSGIPIRGPAPADLGLDPETAALRQWTAANLASYWSPWAAAVAARPERWFAWRPRWSTAWGVLGAPRLHATIVTGEVVSKEEAGEWARSRFDPRWTPLIDDALAYRQGQPDRLHMGRRRRAELTAGFVSEVVRTAEDLAGG